MADAQEGAQDVCRGAGPYLKQKQKTKKQGHQVSLFSFGLSKPSFCSLYSIKSDMYVLHFRRPPSQSCMVRIGIPKYAENWFCVIADQSRSNLTLQEMFSESFLTIIDFLLDKSCNM